MFAVEGLPEDDMDKGLSLAQRIHPKYRPAFDKLSDSDRAAVALYFLPHASEKDVLEVTRPRVIKWYCPFADQREFPSGHRYCINVYTGCEHECQYCYATGYVAAEPNCKNRFRQDLCKDLEALEAYDVPPAPVHLSNSTDPLQPLEEQHRHTLFVLEKLAEHRNRFTTVTLLTKNPAVLMDDRYVQVLHRLSELPPDHPRRAWFDAKGYPPLRVECSLAFFNDEHRRLLDPAAPSVESRMEALRFLRKEGLPVFLRIDPLVPTRPLGRRQDDGGFRPAGCSADARPGRLGQFQPRTGRRAHHLFGRQDHAAQAGRSAAGHGADEAGLPASFSRATARLSRRFLAAAGKHRRGTRAQAVLGPMQPAFDSRQALQDEPDYNALSHNSPGQPKRRPAVVSGRPGGVTGWHLRGVAAARQATESGTAESRRFQRLADHRSRHKT